MIDIHTHILPDMDDGARSIEEAIKMTELLWQQGVRGAVCTPHFDPSQIALDEFINRRTIAMSLMKEAKIPLFPASEIYLHEFLFYYNSLEAVTINNTRYLLLELPFDKKWNNKIYEMIGNLILHFDIIPIIAHIERYPAIRRKHIERLRDIGCLMQLNTSSVLDKKLKRKALNYIGSGLIDVLGSDCHNLSHRPPQIIKPIEEIRKYIGKERCDLLIRQSDRLIEGLD
jgi:protein-tyrosine phosphatase